VSDIREQLHRIDQAIDKLRDARHHVKHSEPEKAEINIVDALRYISKVFHCLDHYHDQNHDCHHHTDHHSHHHCCCNCCCNHSHHQKITLSSLKFFSKVSLGTISGANLIIPANTFVDDNGNGITAFPSVFQYFNLFINGMLQENGVVSISSSLIIIAGGAVLNSNDPIILEFVMST
jgi:hypothetical protein